MTTDELREAYLSFFESKGCVRRPSDLLVPPNDPSVLFTPAGMNQFKEQFLGIGPLDFTRATTCQKCIRTGDIDNVGKTRFHMTMFEMLGNFSFGDYFKRDAIHWAWEFCTRHLKIAPEKLKVTVYLDDDEAYKIWNEEIKLPSSRITRCDEAENFWPASAPSEGPNGVCGPCSEIYVDLKDGRDVEIWNLVFTQFNRTGYKQLEPLPSKNIDTGMGLERAAAVVQGVPTGFDIDNMKKIVAASSALLGKKYSADDPESYRTRRIAEHARTVAFCIHEGVHPSNEKQGYVVRRLLRRAVLDAYQVGCREPVVHQLVPAVIDAMKVPYPELAQTAESVAMTIKSEEERFLATVENGINYLESLFKRIASGSDARISGEDAFKLHATYGFPVELTEDLALSRGTTVDRTGFDEAMGEHRKTSGRGSFSAEVFHVGPIQEIKKTHPPTVFVGYEQAECDSRVLAVIAGESVADTPVRKGHDGVVTLILDQSSFYGESGGQVGDVGLITAPGFEFEVVDTQKTDGYIQHVGKILAGEAKAGLAVRASIDVRRRQGIQRAHSATHLLHWALHQVLGKHATQAGSRVEDDLLRFDFSHPQAMTHDEIERVERLSNERVILAAPIRAEIKPIAQARQEGATALFGEKYGDEVRVVSMGDFSKEFCGGCHLSNTGQAGLVRILREESVAAGTRRLIAATGLGALTSMREQSSQLAELGGLLKAKPSDLKDRVESLQKQVKELEKQVEKERAKQAAGQAQQLLAKAVPIGDVQVLAIEVESQDAKQVEAQADQIVSQGSSLAVLLTARNNGKVEVVSRVGSQVVQKGLSAADWVREVAGLLGGRGGGKPQAARGGGADPSKMDEALAHAMEFARSKLA